MEVGEALKRLFDGKEMTYKEGKLTKKVNIKCHYGDQYELNKWVGIQNASNRQKYPLVYYVLGSNKTELNGKVRTKARIILLLSNKYESLNDQRNLDSYKKILNPLFEIIKEEFKLNPYIHVWGSLPKKYDVSDEPLFGISTNDFAKLKEEPKSATIDVVDAKVIDLDLEININCIK